MGFLEGLCYALSSMIVASLVESIIMIIIQSMSYFFGIFENEFWQYL